MSDIRLLRITFLLGIAWDSLGSLSAAGLPSAVRCSGDYYSTADTEVASSDHVARSKRPTQRPLPERLVVAYPNWGVCGVQVEEAVDSGVNVVAWSFGVLSSTAGPTHHRAQIVLQPDLTCVRDVIERTTGRGRQVIHMLSFGGWGTQHPDDLLSGAEYYAAWARLVWDNARTDGSPLFDGIDWDFEGSDDTSSAANLFSVETLDIMGTMSRLAKSDGFLVSMAPAQSYLDSGSANFSRSLLFDDGEWEAEFAAEQGEAYKRPYFGYHGRNCYAYLLAAHGGWDTFDFVSLQLYESYSRFGYSVQVEGAPIAEALISTVRSYVVGWEVDFSMDPDRRVARLGKREVAVPAEALVIGLLAVSGDPHRRLPLRTPPFAKVFTLLPSPHRGNPLMDAYTGLTRLNLAPRGFMYWCIADEASSTIPFYMARGLAAVLAAPPR